MKFGEYLDVLKLELQIIRYPGQGGRYCARIENAERVEGCLLFGEHGIGSTPKEAINDYLNQIRGRRICVGAFTENRREYDVPQSIEDET